MSIEIWKDITGYEGLYQASNFGNIKSLKRNTAHERILKPRVDKGGYLYVGLTKNGITKTYKVHRLIGLTFIANPKNKYSINHINGNKQDNNVENLEWASAKEQAIHAVKMGLFKWTDDSKEKLRATMVRKGLWYIRNVGKRKYTKTHRRNGHFNCAKPIIQKDDNGNIIKVWLSMSEASRELGVPVPHIVRVCKGDRKHAKGYKWEYAKEGDLVGEDIRKF